MKTASELINQVRELVNSDLSDTVARAACRGMVNFWIDEERPYTDFSQDDVDHAFERGRMQGAAVFETVAAQRDALATQLHARGNAAKPLTAQQLLAAEKAEAALGWISKQPLPTQARSPVRKWHEHEVLPTAIGWYVIQTDGEASDAYWDGMDFVLARKGRLVANQQWAEIKVRRGAK